MRHILSFSIIWVLSLPLFAQAQLVRVRIESSQSRVHLTGTGLRVKGLSGSPLSLIVDRTTTPQGYVWRIKEKSESGQTTHTLTQKVLLIQGQNIKSDDKPLPNNIVLAHKSNLSFDLIASLPLENYLIGVLASEMPLTWPLETLKAQAVAARSYALAVMKERETKVFQLESTISDQVFRHVTEKADNSPLIEKAKKAVLETENMVLVSPLNSKVLKAYYHSDCGGRTSSASMVWGLKGADNQSGFVTDSYCPNNPKAKWTFEIDEASLVRKLQDKFKNKELGEIEALELQRPTEKDRVEKVKVKWSLGQSMELLAHDLRGLLGFDQLKSTNFSVSKIDDHYQFVGKGFGHGVGLCQWGARELGKMGLNMNEILIHYYPKAELRTRSLPELARQTVQPWQWLEAEGPKSQVSSYK